MSAQWLFILNLVRSAECIWWCSGFGVQLVGMWSGIDGMPNLMSSKWTSDRSLSGSLILDEINLLCSHECIGYTRGGNWRTWGRTIGNEWGFGRKGCRITPLNLSNRIWRDVSFMTHIVVEIWAMEWLWGSSEVDNDDYNLYITMMMSRVVLKHQWIMLMVMSQWRMSGSIWHMR